ncbi:hypothetical protein NIES4106_61250 (plasmid) [Fischerella sp. NIES-4106]|nr:hypothetical protein NIES4106_60860 [Fischerella sp. NIES-4106]BAZ71328.1 hypothetical protein NIES4106_61250 [Fischerella sp. NIES-4106]
MTGDSVRLVRSRRRGAASAGSVPDGISPAIPNIHAPATSSYPVRSFKEEKPKGNKKGTRKG